MFFILCEPDFDIYRCSLECRFNVYAFLCNASVFRFGTFSNHIDSNSEICNLLIIDYIKVCG